MKIMLDNGAYMPVRAHNTDAGLDMITPQKIMLPPRGYAVVDTGVHVQLPTGTVGILKSKSGLSVNRGIYTVDGVIDEGYTGAIAVKLHNSTKDYQIINAGEKITQLVIVPCLMPEMELVDDFPETDRGSAGFGSTGV